MMLNSYDSHTLVFDWIPSTHKEYCVLITSRK